MATAIPERFRPAWWMEAMIVIIVFLVLFTVAVPRFFEVGNTDKESILRADLRNYRSAVDAFYRDTGAYPLELSDLASLSAPAGGIDEDGKYKPIERYRWRGPYLGYLDNDPLSNAPFDYSKTPPNVGRVTSSSSGTSRKGIPLKAW